jgi:hypothetical protein
MHYVIVAKRGLGSRLVELNRWRNVGFEIMNDCRLPASQGIWVRGYSGCDGGLGSRQFKSWWRRTGFEAMQARVEEDWIRGRT